MIIKLNSILMSIQQPKRSGSRIVPYNPENDTSEIQPLAQPTLPDCGREGENAPEGSEEGKIRIPDQSLGPPLSS